MTGWRTSTPSWLDEVTPRPDAPAEEPDGPCMIAGCPRTGTIDGDLVACAYHRGAERRAGHRRTGHRGGDVS